MTLSRGTLDSLWLSIEPAHPDSFSASGITEPVLFPSSLSSTLWLKTGTRGPRGHSVQHRYGWRYDNLHIHRLRDLLRGARESEPAFAENLSIILEIDDKDWAAPVTGV